MKHIIMKKTIAFLLAVLTLLLFAACGAQTSEQSNRPTPDSTAPAETTAETAPSSVTETPEPTLTEEERLAKKLNNTVISTEDDLDVIHVGLYSFTMPDGRKLAYTKNALVLLGPDEEGNTSFLVSFQNSGRDKDGRAGVRYVIYPGDTIDKMIYDESNYSVADADEMNMRGNWYIIESEEGVSIKNCGSRRYIAYSEEFGALRSAISPKMEGVSACFDMRLVSEGTACFHQTISEKGNIVLRTSDKLPVRSKLDYTRQAKLVNDMQTAYETYRDLTDFRVWESIVIRVYRKEPFFGYIYGDWNVISFDLASAIDDLGKMVKRDEIGINDWNFCLMHEMGHMFDAGRCWNFEAEFCTNFKVAYNLWANSDVGASAATAAYPYQKCFDGAHIKELWVNEPEMTQNGEYNLDRLLYLFVDYAENIGWDKVRDAYREMQARETQNTPNARARYDLLCDTMAKYASDHLNVNDTIKPDELSVVYKYLDSQG